MPLDATIIQRVPFKTHEPLHSQNDKTNISFESLQTNHVVAANTLLEISTTVI
jgi:hypothetical protein